MNDPLLNHSRGSKHFDNPHGIDTFKFLIKIDQMIQSSAMLFKILICNKICIFSLIRVSIFYKFSCSKYKISYLHLFVKFFLKVTISTTPEERINY
jgi:hypothetical protein